eukprot:354895-Chlamydomonas_euryale.AAC.5
MVISFEEKRQDTAPACCYECSRQEHGCQCVDFCPHNEVDSTSCHSLARTHQPACLACVKVLGGRQTIEAWPFLTRCTTCDLLATRREHKSRFLLIARTDAGVAVVGGPPSPPVELGVFSELCCPCVPAVRISAHKPRFTSKSENTVPFPPQERPSVLLRGIGTTQLQATLN